MDLTSFLAALTALKALGIDTAWLLSLAVLTLAGALASIIVSWKVTTFFAKEGKQAVQAVQNTLAELNLSVKNLTATLTLHDHRMEEGERRFARIEEDIRHLKEHLTKPKEG